MPSTSAASRARSRGTIRPLEPGAPRALGDRQRAAARAQLAAERQLAEDRHALERLGRHWPLAARMPHGDREVEARAVLAQVRGREVDRDRGAAGTRSRS